MKNYFSTDGRITRLEYWLCHLIAFLLISVCAAAVSYGLAHELFVWNIYIWILVVCMSVCFTFWTIILQIKRWHDRDRSGLWIFINFIPLIGPLWAFVELGFIKGSEGLNRYDPGFTGKRLRVRRSSDSIEINVGFIERGFRHYSAAGPMFMFIVVFSIVYTGYTVTDEAWIDTYMYLIAGCALFIGLGITFSSKFLRISKERKTLCMGYRLFGFIPLSSSRSFNEISFLEEIPSSPRANGEVAVRLDVSPSSNSLGTKVLPDTFTFADYTLYNEFKQTVCEYLGIE